MLVEEKRKVMYKLRYETMVLRRNAKIIKRKKLVVGFRQLLLPLRWL